MIKIPPIRVEDNQVISETVQERHNLMWAPKMSSEILSEWAIGDSVVGEVKRVMGESEDSDNRSGRKIILEEPNYTSPYPKEGRVFDYPVTAATIKNLEKDRLSAPLVAG